MCNKVVAARQLITLMEEQMIPAVELWKQQLTDTINIYIQKVWQCSDIEFWVQLRHGGNIED